MNSVNTQLHSDEIYQPSQEDMQEYAAYLDGELEADFDAANAELAQVANEEADTHDEEGNYIWNEEAIQFEDEMDNLYDEDEDYEDDGQPDEAQEWYDFDPDC